MLKQYDSLQSNAADETTVLLPVSPLAPASVSQQRFKLSPEQRKKIIKYALPSVLASLSLGSIFLFLNPSLMNARREGSASRWLSNWLHDWDHFDVPLSDAEMASGIFHFICGALGSVSNSIFYAFMATDGLTSGINARSTKRGKVLYVAGCASITSVSVASVFYTALSTNPVLWQVVLSAVGITGASLNGSANWMNAGINLLAPATKRTKELAKIQARIIPVLQKRICHMQQLAQKFSAIGITYKDRPSYIKHLLTANEEAEISSPRFKTVASGLGLLNSVIINAAPAANTWYKLAEGVGRAGAWPLTTLFNLMPAYNNWQIFKNGFGVLGTLFSNTRHRRPFPNSNWQLHPRRTAAIYSAVIFFQAFSYSLTDQMIYNVLSKMFGPDAKDVEEDSDPARILVLSLVCFYRVLIGCYFADRITRKLTRNEKTKILHGIEALAEELSNQTPSQFEKFYDEVTPQQREILLDIAERTYNNEALPAEVETIIAAEKLIAAERAEVNQELPVAELPAAGVSVNAPEGPTPSSASDSGFFGYRSRREDTKHTASDPTLARASSCVIS